GFIFLQLFQSLLESRWDGNPLLAPTGLLEDAIETEASRTELVAYVRSVSEIVNSSCGEVQGARRNTGESCEKKKKFKISTAETQRSRAATKTESRIAKIAIIAKI